MKISCVALAAIAGVMCASVAEAQEIPCGEGACLKKRRRGTHFIAEINGGGTVQRDGGFAVGGLLGVGGKVPLLPLRAYLIGEFDYSTSHGSGVRAPLEYSDVRHYRDLTLGLRLYLPIWAGLRLFADVQGGGSHQAVALEREDLPPRLVSGWTPHFQLAGGAQYRLMHHLSLGLRARVVFTDPDMAGLYALVGEPVPYRTSLTAGITWHF